MRYSKCICLVSLKIGCEPLDYDSDLWLMLTFCFFYSSLHYTSRLVILLQHYVRAALFMLLKSTLSIKEETSIAVHIHFL